jgi:2,4-dienoyl-CoA reductase-like NADH-dependent reductase (Old Yellow Enzyme family)
LSKSLSSLVKDHDVRLAIYRLLLDLSSGLDRQAKRTIALSKILVRRSITTPDEIDAIEKEFAAFVAVETALDPELVERIKRARARELESFARNRRCSDAGNRK